MKNKKDLYCYSIFTKSLSNFRIFQRIIDSGWTTSFGELHVFVLSAICLIGTLEISEQKCKWWNQFKNDVAEKIVDPLFCTISFVFQKRNKVNQCCDGTESNDDSQTQYLECCILSLFGFVFGHFWGFQNCFEKWESNNKKYKWVKTSNNSCHQLTLFLCWWFVKKSKKKSFQKWKNSLTWSCSYSQFVVCLDYFLSDTCIPGNIKTLIVRNDFRLTVCDRIWCVNQESHQTSNLSNCVDQKKYETVGFQKNHFLCVDWHLDDAHPKPTFNHHRCNIKNRSNLLFLILNWKRRNFKKEKNFFSFTL